MNGPLISVIIPNYNYGRYLAQAIDSALAQTYAKVEVIVVDDGSTDESHEVLGRYGEKIRWLSQENQGVSAARNRGVEESRGEILAFLDSDDLWLPAKLERQARLLLSDTELGLVHCGYVEFDDDGNLLKEHLDGMEGWVAAEMLRLQRPVVLGGGSAAIMTRRAFNEVGGFDRRLTHGEDWDLYFRVARQYKVGFVPEVLVRYREHGVNCHLNVRRTERSWMLAFDKAFAGADPELRGIRRACYGKLHSILAGSFFRAGHYFDFARHMTKSLWLSPSNFARVLGFPARWWQRRQDHM